MREAQDQQKSYANTRRRQLEFNVREKKILNISPMKGIMLFGLNLRYIGPLEILKRIGVVTC